jgi:hypothetical protein
MKKRKSMQEQLKEASEKNIRIIKDTETQQARE